MRFQFEQLKPSLPKINQLFRALRIRTLHKMLRLVPLHTLTGPNKNIYCRMKRGSHQHSNKAVTSPSLNMMAQIKHLAQPR
jgi:hypothetical protein